VLDTGENSFNDLGFLQIPSRSETRGNRRCVVVDFLAPYDGHPTQRTLVVERLQSAPEWNPAALIAGLKEYGIQIIIHETEHEFEIVTMPPDVDVAAAINAVQGSLSKKIEGPWMFTLDIP
jgi:hypothetical protein